MKRGFFHAAPVVLVLALTARTARSEDKRAEAAAQAALVKARESYAASSFAPAIALLQKAVRACGATKCTAPTHAALERDLGAIQLRNGEQDEAAASFEEALKIDPQGEPSAGYDSPALHAAWLGAKDEASVAGAAQPSGDFVHTPVAEQAESASLPVYVEYSASSPLVKVILKYKGTGMHAYAQIPMVRVAKGWGAVVPCAAMVRGVVRYYVVGLDADGTPTASSGDPKRPYFVPVRHTISTEPPALPGMPPPPACSEVVDTAVPVTQLVKEPDASPERAAKPEEPEDGAYARYWIGVAGSIDFVSLSSANDVCKLSSSGSGYYCTDPYGNDFPSRKSSAENDTLLAGKSGQVSGGPVAGNIRAMIAADYALTANMLAGARFGYVLNRYPGHAGVSDGKVFKIPVHIEVRGTYVFGSAPLAHVGVAPFAFVAGGVSEFDASHAVEVIQTGILGPRTMVAWKSGGPAFLALGGGGRYALSARSAVSAGIKITGALGPTGLTPNVGPEISVQYGF